MAIYKRYKGRRLKRTDAIGTKAPGGLNSVYKANTSINRFPARALWLRLNEPKAKSEKRSMNGDTIPGKKLFSEFVDETFLPWSRANKRSYREDEQRSVTLKDFFGREASAGHQANDDRELQARAVGDADEARQGGPAQAEDSGERQPRSRLSFEDPLNGF
jgi:hypothetical protein